jgi:hypothetical protein
MPIAVSTFLDTPISVLVIPVAAIGHVIGLKLHDKIIANDQQFKKWIGSALLLISSFGLLKLFLS